MNFPGLPGISGMVKVGANDFLVVHDTKDPKEAWLGTICVQKNGPKYQQVAISNWPIDEHPPYDVEAICRISDPGTEYLVMESGFYRHGQFGRVIEIRYPGEVAGKAEYLGSFRPFSAPPNGADTPRSDQIEGVAVVNHDGMTVLLLALRGGRAGRDSEVLPGQLIWGTLTNIHTVRPTFKKIGSHSLTYDPIADRGAADLYVQHNGSNTWDVYSVATSDPDDSGDYRNLGPFRSAVYLAGTLTINVPNVCFAVQNTEKIIHWDFEGLKVEAIAAPAEIFKDSGGLSIATDDEFYNGIWRPIARSRESRSPSPLLFFKNAKLGFALK
jgi:hypothetical protein